MGSGRRGGQPGAHAWEARGTVQVDAGLSRCFRGLGNVIETSPGPAPPR